MRSKILKSLVVITCFAMTILVLVGCSKADKDGYYDNAFMTALEKGLVARWKISDKEDSKSSYKKAVQAELDSVEEYQDKKFKNTQLKAAALDYINGLKEQKSVLKYWGADDFDERWSAAYDKRTAALVAINKIHKIKVSEKKDNLSELLGNGKSVNEKENLKKKIDAMLAKAKVERDDSEDLDGEYVNIIIKNNTGKDYSFLTATVKFKDKDGVVVDSQDVTAEGLADGETTRLRPYVETKDWETYQLVLNSYELKK